MTEILINILLLLAVAILGFITGWAIYIMWNIRKYKAIKAAHDQLRHKRNAELPTQQKGARMAESNSAVIRRFFNNNRN